MDEDLRVASKAEEALAYVIRARGALYEFHHMIGRADVLFAEVGEARPELVERIVARDAVGDRWSYQLVQDFDGGYYADAVAAAQAVRDEIAGGLPHVPEATMKSERRTDPG